MKLPVPARRRAQEILDDPAVTAATRLRSLADVARSNRIFGGRRAAVAAIEASIDSDTRSVTLLDVGTGLADIPAELGRRCGRRGIQITTIGLDEAGDLLGDARRDLTHAVCGSVRGLPFRDGSVDIVLCSQLLHHFADDDISAVIAELDRVARTRVIIADLRRSWIAAAGFWLASFPLRFHPVTRHDGVVSVFRGFTAAELRRFVIAAVGRAPSIERRLGFRLTVSWAPRSAE
jgi:ubiquinone/menaquinone biosynthesis C-methylase UbiE